MEREGSSTGERIETEMKEKKKMKGRKKERSRWTASCLVVSAARYVFSQLGSCVLALALQTSRSTTIFILCFDLE